MLMCCFLSENIHLSAYTSEHDFYARCYPRYLSLLTKAGEFLAATGGTEEKTMIFIRSVIVTPRNILKLLWTDTWPIATVLGLMLRNTRTPGCRGTEAAYLYVFACSWRSLLTRD